MRSGKYGALALVVSSLLTGAVQAGPLTGSLNLIPGTPDIASAFIDVAYVGNSTTGILSASGFAQQLFDPNGNIVGGSFDIAAAVNSTAGTASGTLAIGGTIAGLGFISGTLLTGTLSTLGAGPGDPLEFLFAVTGGDAAGLFGPTAGVILSQSGYTGSFASNFSSAPFGALSDTFAPVPEPSTYLLTGLGLGVVGLVTRKRRRTAA